MSSNFWSSSHARYHLHPRSALYKARAIDLKYTTPHHLYCLFIWFTSLIQKLGKRLSLRQIPIATATVFFRRFYLKNAICETNPYLVLAACVFVAAKVEETPVHIKSVVTEAKAVFSEFSIKLFPTETTKLGEMEFYLLEDLDFHLVVFHPYRALLHICGREMADGGRFDRSRVEEDAEIRKLEEGRRKKREEQAKKAGQAVPAGSSGGTGTAPSTPGVSSSKSAVPPPGDDEETEEKRIRRLMSRGSGEGLMEIEESVVQICLFITNDTYRSPVHLLYPPHIIALSVLYLGFTLTRLAPTDRSRTRSSSSQLQTLAASLETNTALGLPPPPAGTAEFMASFEISWPVLLACLQDIVALYPIWEGFEPARPAAPQLNSQNTNSQNTSASYTASSGSGADSPIAPGTITPGMTLAQAAAASGKLDPAAVLRSLQRPTSAGRPSGGNETFGPVEAEALVRRMIEERMVDLSHPENAGAGSAHESPAQIAGRKRKA